MKPFSERKKSTIAVILIAIILLIAGYIEVKADDKIIILPTNTDKEQDSSTTILQDKDGGQTMVHCLSTETGLVYCIEL